MLNDEAMLRHLKKALEIAYNQNIIVIAAAYEPYYSNEFDIVLKDFPDEFSALIREKSEIIRKNFSEFTLSHNITKIYSSLNKNDFRLALFAVRGYTYKQVAKIMNVSVRTVASRYSRICEKVGVKSKQELAELMADRFNDNK